MEPAPPVEAAPVEPGRPVEAASVPVTGRRALGVFGLYLAGQFVVALAVGIVLVAAAVLDGTDPSDANAMAAVAMRIEGPAGVAGLFGGGLAIGALELRRRRRRDPAFRRAIGWMPAHPGVVLGALVAGVLLAVAYLWIVGTLLPPKQDVTPGPLARMAASPGWQQQVWRLTALVLSPPIEEFLFRGVLLAGFASAAGGVFAGVATTALFVAMHYFELVAYPPAILGLTAIGVLALVLRLRTGSLLPAVATHFGYNLTLVLLHALALRS